MAKLDEKTLSLDDLLLDPNNYRFQDTRAYVAAAEKRFADPTVQNRAYMRIRDSGIAELKSSILHNGFLPFERIVVVPFNDGKYLVVEGNRRIAALRWLKDDHDAGVELRQDVLSTLDAVPVIVIANIDEDPALRLSLMGVRHVGGIKGWGGYQRAKLVTELRDDFDLDTGEVAARLGMSAHEVNRRYRAFKALEQMMQDEEYGDLAVPEMYPLFHEAVAGTLIKEWLGWSEESLLFTNQDTLHQFYDLIAPAQLDDDDNTHREPKLTTREEVRDLREVLVVPRAKNRLLDADGAFADALALAKADDIARTWVTQVSEAVSALMSVSALELPNISDEALGIVRQLQRQATAILETHQILSEERSKRGDLSE